MLDDKDLKTIFCVAVIGGLICAFVDVYTGVLIKNIKHKRDGEMDKEKVDFIKKYFENNERNLIDELESMTIQGLENRCLFCGSLACYGKPPESEGCPLPEILEKKKKNN